MAPLTAPVQRGYVVPPGRWVHVGGLDTPRMLFPPPCGFLVPCLPHIPSAGCRSVAQPADPLGTSLGDERLVPVQRLPRPQAHGCGFPFSPPFPLAGTRGWGEPCVAHCGRVSPLGIAFWHGDARRKRLACGHRCVPGAAGRARGCQAAGFGCVRGLEQPEGCAEEGGALVFVWGSCLHWVHLPEGFGKERVGECGPAASPLALSKGKRCCWCR